MINMSQRKNTVPYTFKILLKAHPHSVTFPSNFIFKVSGVSGVISDCCFATNTCESLHAGYNGQLAHGESQLNSQHIPQKFV